MPASRSRPSYRSSRELGLTVDDNGVAAREPEEIDALFDPVVRDVEPLMDLALAIHALTNPGLAHQRGEAMLEHACANTPQNVFARMLLEHDSVDATPVKQLGQE